MSPEKMMEADRNIAAKIEALDKPEEEVNEPDGAVADDDATDTDRDNDGDEPTEAGESEDGADTGEEDGGESDGEDEDGYTIDEDEEEEPEPELEGVTPEQVAALNPEQKYILDNLKPITVRGSVGDGQVQSYEVYDPSQLPAGFNYLDQRELSVANKAFGMLESEATRLQNDFRGQQSTKVAAEFKKREDAADRQDIGKLQREGDIPKFKAQPNSKDFAEDPASVLIQSVLDFKEETNNRYLEEYNAGRPYKHIGFEEAFEIYQRKNPTKGNAEQRQEDAARKQIAKRTSKARGSESNSAPNKPRVHSGMSSRDLDNLIDRLDW